ncbi:MAG TPA: metallophosphoesterase, partial [Actinomycetota bacterium]|nr:metallophosphoesterase [Actinomycetota bacterium]
AVEGMTGKQVADAPTTPPDIDSPAYQFTPTRSALQIADTYVESQKNGSHHFAPGLPERLRCSYAATGCDNSRLEIPHYAVFGNHDASVRGTLTMQRGFNAPTAAFGRYFLESQREFINEWFKTTAIPGPVGHGFERVDAERWNDQNDRNDGYYAFDSANGKVRMVVINTIFDGVRGETHRGGQTGTDTKGLVAGNEVTPAAATSEQGFMDQAQFDWLKKELDTTRNTGKAVLVFSHHPDRSFSYAQYGSKLPEELNRLLGSYPNVAAHIAGHTHENIINPCSATDCKLKGSHLSGIENGFWRIETSSMIDFPQESRIIEVYRLPDGTFAIRSTMIQADQSDADASLSHRLSVAEADCKTSNILGGPLSSGPYDQARLQKAIANTGEAAIRSKYCIQGLDKSAGEAKDRDVLLLP